MFVKKRAEAITSVGEGVQDRGEGEGDDVETAKHCTPEGENTSQPVWEVRGEEANEIVHMHTRTHLAARKWGAEGCRGPEAGRRSKQGRTEHTPTQWLLHTANEIPGT